MRTFILLSLLVVVFPFAADAQQDSTSGTSLLDLVQDSTPTTQYVNNAFKSTRVIMGQSIEMVGAGSLDFRILHRFGPITNGVQGLFGIDQSFIRFSFDYAPINDLLVGLGRSNTN